MGLAPQAPKKNFWGFLRRRRRRQSFLGAFSFLVMKKIGGKMLMATSKHKIYGVFLGFKKIIALFLAILVYFVHFLSILGYQKFFGIKFVVFWILKSGVGFGPTPPPVG